MVAIYSPLANRRYLAAILYKMNLHKTNPDIAVVYMINVMHYIDRREEIPPLQLLPYDTDAPPSEPGYYVTFATSGQYTNEGSSILEGYKPTRPVWAVHTYKSTSINMNGAYYVHLPWSTLSMYEGSQLNLQL